MRKRERHFLQAKTKIKFKELKEVRHMRENFEKLEKQALRSSKVYKDVHKMKKGQIADAEKRMKKGTGEAYVDSDRRIAVGLGIYLSPRLVPRPRVFVMF